MSSQWNRKLGEMKMNQQVTGADLVINSAEFTVDSEAVTVEHGLASMKVISPKPPCTAGRKDAAAITKDQEPGTRGAAPPLLGRTNSSNSSGQASIMNSPLGKVLTDLERGPKLAHQRSEFTYRSTAPLDVGIGEQYFPALGAFLRSRWFDACAGVVILANCIAMSFEVEMVLGHLPGWDDVLAVSEHVFTAIFFIEIALRFTFFSWRHFVPWSGGTWSNFCDFAIVMVTGVGAVWILPLFNVKDNTAVQALTILRALRLVRMVRVVSRIEFFQEVWLLLRGLSESMRVLFWTSVVIFFITYMFAIFGAVLISVELQKEYERATSASDKAQLENLLEILGSVTSVMFTLVQVLTLDSWTQIVRDTMDYVPWCWVYFYGYVSVAVFVLMNLVTAIIVDNALKNSQKDENELLELKEKERFKVLEQIRGLFQLIDADGSGGLTRQEFEDAFDVPEVAGKLRMLDIQPQDLRELFHLLDSGDGVLSLEEFFDGITHMEGTAQSKDVFKILKHSEHLHRRLQRGMCRMEAKFERSLSTSMSRLNSNLEDGLQSVPKTHSTSPVLQKLDEVMSAITACNEKVDACNQRVATLSEEVAAIVNADPIGARF
eukprot:TRINITY_DN22734_c3_g1_i1.p1 TRINITY_DN22734_c3_g1~~TRINITY_DN22734_c3_g1_i1.p1  ORF type:complete len:604 (-),score=106.90 TRINITY_DN22734_c3_g1_i1:254-2065(-)